ncbi:MAG: hypothetical protein R6U15_05190, partial [Candidatus Izemoplasmatales bacterium]
MKTIKSITKKAFNLAKDIIDKLGPRLAGTKPALETADILKNELEPFADKVDLEEFYLRKGAFLGWIKILV